MRYSDIWKIMHVPSMEIDYLFHLPNKEGSQMLAYVFRVTMAKTTPPKEAIPEVKRIQEQNDDWTAEGLFAQLMEKYYPDEDAIAMAMRDGMGQFRQGVEAGYPDPTGTIYDTDMKTEYEVEVLS